MIFRKRNLRECWISFFSIDEVRDFATEEKEKRLLRDNPPVVISENTNLSGAENDIVENA